MTEVNEKKINEIINYVQTRKTLLKKLQNMLINRERLNKQILSLRKELNSLDNMIL